MTLLASPSNGAATLGIVAGLTGEDQTRINVRDHNTAGLVYTFHRGMGQIPLPEQPGAPPVVVLVDNDRNGSVTGVLQITETELPPEGLAESGELQ